MSGWITALIFAIGATAWFYNYLARNNGNASPQSNLTISAVAGTILFLIVLTIINAIFHQ